MKYAENKKFSIRIRKLFYSGEKQCLFLVYLNNFEEIMNTGSFLLNQLDYLLSISMKR